MVHMVLMLMRFLLCMAWSYELDLGIGFLIHTCS